MGGISSGTYIRSYKDIQYSPQMIFLANVKTDKSKVVIGTPSASLVDIGDGVFCFEYHTKMNAINGEIVNMVPKVVEFIHTNGAGMVNGNQASGMPGAFSAGGEPEIHARSGKQRDFQGINNFIADVHEG
jgi:3-hydroxyacyl-CoA dehydrogenase